MKEFLCPMCLALKEPERVGHWVIMADFILTASSVTAEPGYQRHLLSTYLQRAYEKGKEKGRKETP